MNRVILVFIIVFGFMVLFREQLEKIIMML